MSKADIEIDLNPVVSAILRVLVEPYKTFVAKLHSDGRITTAEIVELRQAFFDRSERLADLVKAELQVTPPPPTGSSPEPV